MRGLRGFRDVEDHITWQDDSKPASQAIIRLRARRRPSLRHLACTSLANLEPTLQCHSGDLRYGLVSFANQHRLLDGLQLNLLPCRLTHI